MNGCDWCGGHPVVTNRAGFGGCDLCLLHADEYERAEEEVKRLEKKVERIQLRIDTMRRGLRKSENT